MEHESSQVVVAPVAQETTISTREESITQCDGVYSQEQVKNSLNLQIKDQETCYIPRDWVMSKLDQIKATASLSVETTVLPEAVRVTENVLSLGVNTYMNKTATMELHFFEDGIVKFNCINPANPSKFSFELVDKPANLTPYLWKVKSLSNPMKYQ